MDEDSRFSSISSMMVDNEDEDSFLKNGESSNSGKVEESEEEMERRHFNRVIQAYKNYENHSLKRLLNTVKYIRTLPSAHQELLKSYRKQIDLVQSCIEHNHQILQVIVQDASNLFHHGEDDSNRLVDEDMKLMCAPVRTFDMEKVQTILKQMCREWSREGKEERDASFNPILEEITARFPRKDLESSSSVRVLVPGAGLGRLAYEIAKLGYSCQGNEFSLFMLFASNFILNKCQGIDLYKIYPWVHQYHNNLKSQDQTESVHFPDVNPCDLPSEVEFSMAAGSFVEIYNNPDTWDCICTCFFLDTANNVIDYIETTWRILKPGGLWINLGPLLYHHADMPQQKSIEPSYEEIRVIIVKFGFKFLKEEVNLPTPYAQNPRSMISYEYRSIFFVCQKPDNNCPMS